MRQWKRYLIVGGFLMLLIVVQFRNPEITGPYKGLLGNLLNPFVYLISLVSKSVENVWGNYIFLVGVEKENQMLREQADKFSLENSILSEKLVQLDNLNKLLQFRDVYDFNTIAANVIGWNIDGYISYLTIDRGERDGIKVNDPIVSANGLVGKVSRTYYGTSQVVALYYHDFSVSVLNSRTRVVGVMKGDGHGGLYVDYYDRLDDVRVGDRLVTSGLSASQIYPKGISVGVVKDIISPPTGLFQKLVVTSSVDLYKLEQVLVVKREEADAPAP
jgi:rod shape-determining protein MreC